MRLRGSTLFKYIVSYILVLAITFGGFYVILTFQVRDKYQQTQQQEVALKVENLAKVIGQSFSNIQTTDFLIQNNMTIINARYQQSPYLRYEAVKELQKLATANPVIRDILYLDVQNQDALAANSTCFYKAGSYYIKTTGGDVRIPEALIDTGDYNNCVYVLEGGGIVFHLFLCPNNSGNYRILYLLNENYLRMQINTYRVQEILAVGLVCGDAFVFSTDSTRPEQVTVKGLGYRAFVPVDEDTDLYLEKTANEQIAVGAFINRSYLWEHVEGIFHTAYWVLALLGALGLVLVFFAVRSTYLPLHELTKRATKTDRVVKDDIQLLSRAFDDSVSEKNALASKVRYYQKMLKTSLLQTERGRADFDRNIEQIFSESFRGRIWVVILFSEPRDWVWEAEETAGFTLTPLEEGASHLALLISAADAEATVLPLVEALRRRLGCKAAYSDASANPMDVARLYYRAKQAQPYAQKRGVCGYEAIRGLVENQKGLPYPYETLDALSLSLREYDFDEAGQAMDTLFRFMDGANVQPVFVRCILIDALTLLNTTMNTCGVRFEHYRERFEDTLALCRDGRYKEHKGMIYDNFRQIVAVFAREAANTGVQIAQVIRFVDANCRNADFSLRYLADHFHVSPAYMSSLFAKKFHMSFSEYVWKVRLEAAKILLETTDDSIEQICQAVGYEIPSSFRRKFKQEVGLSPSEYRRMRTADGVQE